ncbi:hypothetical protein M0802_002503 [Mischocyttarus mexicanus]|nr:hypothetical protein M0802_002503 [Mischocyttarus mexicanus]
MIGIILALSFLSMLDINHQVGGQDLKSNTSMISTTSSSVIVDTENTTTMETSGKVDDPADPFQDILFDPSLIVARLNRDVDNKGSTFLDQSDFKNIKNKHYSNIEEDLNTEENKRYSAFNWYHPQNWQIQEQRPTYKQESYRRFLKYPIFSGR